MIDTIVGFLNTYLSEGLLVALLFIAGIYFTIRLKGVQFSMLGESIRVLNEKPSEKKAISPFETLMITTGARVGTGNIVGVSSAICIGGPGAVFWMWLMAVLGGATSYVESTLAQIYKKKSNDRDNDGTSYGGPAFYIEKVVKKRWLSIIFSVFLFLTYSVGFNMVMSYNLVDSFSRYAGGREAFFATPIPYILAVVVAAMVGLSIFGGAKRLTKIAGILVPIMSVGFILLSLIVVVCNITNIPSMFAAIFRSAFNFKAIFGGFAGSCLMFGIKRGLFSNEAGIGSAPNAAAAAETSHPAKQGLVQMLSVFIDTLIICSATAFLCLCSGIEPSADIAGVAYVQQAVTGTLGNIGLILVTAFIVLFAFTSMTGNLTYCNSAWKYIFKNDIPSTVKVGYRIFGLIIIFIGAIVKASTVWNIADLLMSCMCIINIPIICVLGNKAIGALDDYRQQKKAGKDPVFKATSIGISDTDFWK